MLLRRYYWPLLLLLVGAVLLAGVSIRAVSAQNKQTLTLYSARSAHLIQPLLDIYQRETGTEIRLLTDKSPALLERLLREGESSPADIFMTVDAGNLWYAAERGVLRSTDSKVLTQRIPEHWRDSKNRWFGLSMRVRTIVYNPDLTSADEITHYRGLADSRWKNRLCLRTSQKVYNQSLIAMMIDAYGEQKTQQIVRGWVNNLASKVYSSDTLALQAVADGECAVTLVNTYYLARMLDKDPTLKLRLAWPDQDGAMGVHANISGAGITRHAPNPDAALKFLEWLVSNQAQKLYAELGFEYPILPGVALHPIVAKWPGFEPDNRPIQRSGMLQRQAVMLADRVGYL